MTRKPRDRDDDDRSAKPDPLLDVAETIGPAPSTVGPRSGGVQPKSEETSSKDSSGTLNWSRPDEGGLTKDDNTVPITDSVLASLHQQSGTSDTPDQGTIDLKPAPTQGPDADRSQASPQATIDTPGGSELQGTGTRPQRPVDPYATIDHLPGTPSASLGQTINKPASPRDPNATAFFDGASRIPSPGSSEIDVNEVTGLFSHDGPAQSPSTTSEPLNTHRAPRTIASYTIEGILGRGGMGIVYRARQNKLGRPVALKMVLGGAHATEQALDRFIIEAKAVAHLQHPNIVQIFEVGEYDNLPFFSLEFVNGSSLDRYLNGKPLSQDEAAKLMITLCEAMQYAHNNGILHRDLKPANVLLTKEGVPKITDFGLAKNLEEQADESKSTSDGTIMGTPSYMSPEQARGAVHELGPATDQYSLGAMLYEFLTGRPPFLAPKPYETIMQVLRDEPVSPRQMQPNVPIDLETICLKALQKEPEKRYPSCSALAADLGRFLRNEPIQARPVGKWEQAWRWYKRNPAIGNLSAAIAVALLAIAGISTWSAFSLQKKNQDLASSESRERKAAELARQNEQLAKTKAQDAIRNSLIALRNEQIAADNAALAKRRADRVVTTVQEFFEQVRMIDTLENPGVEERRNLILQKLLPVVQEEVLREEPQDEKAQLTMAALRKAVADDMASQNMKEDAERNYMELERFLRQRAELKKSDVARSNHANIIRSIAELKRDHARDMKQSLEYHQQQLAIAEDILGNSRADSAGLGQNTDLQKYQMLARANHDVGITYYRIGNLTEARRYVDKALEWFAKAIEAFPNDPKLATRPEAERLMVGRALKEGQSTSQLAASNIRVHQGDFSAAEGSLRESAEKAKEASDKYQFNGLLLRDYIGKLGLLGEYLAITNDSDEGLQKLELAASLSDRLLSFAPKNSDFLRVAGLAYFRLAQWQANKGSGEIAAAQKRCLELRRNRFAADPRNVRAKVELMLIESLAGDAEAGKKIADEFAAYSVIDNELLLELARSYSQLADRQTDAEAKTSLQKLALASIEKAMQQEYADPFYLKHEPGLMGLHAIPEFQTLLGRMQ
ncbi:MAG: protein kinase domain-containing protein [Pirellulaceae bacterium]